MGHMNGPLIRGLAPVEEFERAEEIISRGSGFERVFCRVFADLSQC